MIGRELSRWRRHLHHHPELSFHEVETTNYLIEELKKMSVDIVHGRNRIGLPTGVVATVGDKVGPVIALRADIDALPIQEHALHDYKSCSPNVMHACGHDGHAAMLLGAAKQLSLLHKQMPLKGKVKFIFQPAEETENEEGKTGAQYLINAGVLDDVDAIYALHIDPEQPIGTIKLCEGLAMANVDTFSIDIRGTGGHGAYPNQTIDPIWLTAMTLPTLYSLTNRRVSPLEPAVLSLGMIQGGAQTNVIPDCVTIKGTMRTYTDEARIKLENELRTTLQIVTTLGGEVEFTVHRGEPALYNDMTATTILRESIQKAYPSTIVLNERYGMGGEDFSYMTRKVPGAMCFLGAKKEGLNACLHQPIFDFDETILEIGTGILVQAVLTSIAKGG
ncbi:M20 metallopeptidase family protein [Bacillus solitudinis]|uniref:M20 metallopeptidase family protein n=1 Tax=Bacillus solitudinis TaxID=2014074 RepID=UPI000C24D7B4|nr:amidohydrolase [Bacillus solitudinis]